jgi:hypothetical protein
MLDYWDERKDSIYLYVTRAICMKLVKMPNSVIDIGSNKTPILEWFRGYSNKLVSLDLFNPYEADGVQSVMRDFLTYETNDKFTLALCLQVLEHVDDAESFARKLLTISNVLVISVPYKWKFDACIHHVHDPVDEEKLFSWFAKNPVYSYLATELNGVKRLIQVYIQQST